MNAPAQARRQLTPVAVPVAAARVEVGSADWRVQLVRRGYLVMPLLLGAALLLPGLGTMPGLHGDEAWVALRVRELARGAHRLTAPQGLDGMNFYTGVLHQCLVWPVVAVLGETPATLRLPGVAFTLLALALVVRTMACLLGRRTALAAGLLLASSPALVLLGRFGIEVTALTPLLAAIAFAGLATAARGRPSPSLRTIAGALVAGLALGVAGQNHLVALPLALTAGGVGLLFHGRRLVQRPEAGAALAGMALGFLPRLLALAREDSVKQWMNRGDGSFVPDLRYLPALLEWGWDGRILYQRFAGDRGHDWPYPLAAAGLLMALRLGCRLGRPSRTALAAAVALVLAAVTTTALAPTLAPRYFVVCFWMLPLLLAWFARPLLRARQRWVRRTAAATLGLVVALNLWFVATCFFRVFLRDGGGLSSFRIGTRLTETSNHFVSTEGLLAELQRKGIGRVYASFFIAMPLRVLDRGRTLEIITWDAADPPPREPQFGAPPTAVVYYESPGPDFIAKGPVNYHRDRTFPAKFRVYLAELMSP